MISKQLSDHPHWDIRPWGTRGRQMAPPTLSLLVKRAREGEPITYSELADALESKYGFAQPFRKTFYGSPVGLVGYVLQTLGDDWGTTLPPLNVIVVGKTSRQPGSGADPLLRDYFKAIGQSFTPKQRPVLVDEAQRAVFDYGHRWQDVAEALRVRVWTPSAGRSTENDVLKLPKLGGGGLGESPEHYALKVWAKEHPAFFQRHGRFATGKNEYPLSSGDVVDVHFVNGQQRLAVEVKPRHASPDEVKRGVFQVVKYRAVMRAEQRAQCQVPNAQAVLLTSTRPDAGLRALLRRLEVEHMLAPSHAED